MVRELHIQASFLDLIDVCPLCAFHETKQTVFAIVFFSTLS